MNRDGRYREKFPDDLESRGFRQTRNENNRFPGSEWDSNGEFGKNSGFRDRRDAESNSRPYDMDNFRTGKQFSYTPMERENDRGHIGKGPKGYRRSDERIRDEACGALFHSSSVDASDVDVTVEKGHVTLSGTVNSRFEKREAEDSIEHLSGVVDVHNHLRLKTKLDTEVKDQH